MPDFNSGSGPMVPVDLERYGADAAERINLLIEEALIKANNERPARDYLGGSELGDDCLRRVYLNAIKAPKKAYNGKKLRIFWMGHVFESMVAEWFKMAGFILRDRDDQGNQFEVVTANGRIKNHCDGIFTSGPTIPNLIYPSLWENKALKSKYWNMIVKKGVKKAEPKYYAQIQMYLGYFKISFCLFTAINKDTAEIYHEIIPFDLATAQETSDNGVMIIRHLDQGTAPTRPYPRPDHWKCRMCDFAEACWTRVQ